MGNIDIQPIASLDELEEQQRQTGMAPSVPPSFAQNLRSAQGGVDPATGLALDGTGQPMVTGLPRAMTPEQARAQAYVPSPAMAAPQAASPTMPPPGHRLFKESKAGGGSVSYTEMAPEWHQARAAEAAAIGAEKEAAKKATAAKIAEKGVDVDEAAAGEAAILGREQARQQLVDRANADLETKQQVAQAEFEKYRKMEPRSFWADRTTGDKVLASFAVALGALGGAMSGSGQNMALSTLNTAIDKDYQKQLQAIEKQRSVYETARQNVSDARTAKSDSLADFNAQWAGRMEALKAKYMSMRAKAGQGTVSAEGDAVLNAIDEKRAAFEMKAAEALKKEHTATWQKTLVEQDPPPGKGGAGGAASPLSVPDLNGNYAGEARRPDEAEKIRAAQAATTSLRDTLNNLKTFIDQHGTFQVPLVEASARKEKELLMSTAAGALTTMLMTGTLQQGEYNRYTSMLTPDALQSRDGAKAVIDKLIHSAENAYNKRLESNFIRPAGQPQAPQVTPQAATPTVGYQPPKKHVVNGKTLYEADI